MCTDNFTITKRDGKKEKFSLDKIKSAILKAFSAVGQPIDNEGLQKVMEHLRFCNGMSVEDIQNQVEVALMAERHFKVAKTFMLYRKQHEDDRETAEKLSFLFRYVDAENPATGSKFDANANVENKNIATLIGELPKQGFIRLNRRLITDRLKQMYSKELSDRYLYLLNNHFIYKNDETSLANYCASITMYPWLLSGTRSIGGNSTAPTNLKSFCGGFVNMVFIVSSMLSGACATPEFLMYMSYFLQKEYGDDFYARADQQADLSLKSRTIDKVITDCFEQIVYSINQPTGARNFQSVFWNISYYDKNYFESIFGEFFFPDGSKPSWPAVSWLQKRFMRWFNQERTKCVLTFPVETMALLTKDGEVIDKEYGDFTAEMYAEGHSFFTYMSDMLPPAQRNPGQRLQLYARRWWSEHRFKERAYHQHQPLRTAGNARGHTLYRLSRTHHRPRTQGAARIQRKPQGAAGEGHAASLRCWIHQYQAPVPDGGCQWYGRGRREPGHYHQRQPRVRGIRRRHPRTY